MEYIGGFYGNINNLTEINPYFRQVLATTPTMQLVVMSVETEIGMEVHPYTTQFIRIESGTGMSIINKQAYPLFDGMSVVIPPNTEHNIINTGSEPLKLYTLYSPPNHARNRLDVEKPEEDECHEDH